MNHFFDLLGRWTSKRRTMQTAKPFETPVLLMIYNRPDTTRRVFAEIQKLKPLKLYIAADGPKNSQEDRDKCESTRAVVETIDWDCEVKLRFSEENIGCGLGVAIATGWFFDNEPEGIVLEDDTLPNQSFFWFCRELLAKYRHDKRIMLIGGNNFQGGIVRGDGSYYFGKYPNMWGWAGWRRTWQQFDFEMKAFPQFRDQQLIKNVFEQIPEQEYWLDIFARTFKGRIDCWDYQMVFAIWANGGLCITPNVNLVSNIGCGHPDATHTTISDDPLGNVPTSPMDKVIHPTFVMRDVEADRHDSRHVFSIDTNINSVTAEEEFSGDYSSWKEAARQTTGYQSEAIFSKVRNSALKVKSGEAAYERDSVLFENIQINWSLLSALLWVASLSDNRLNLIDFGGALGTSYFQNRKFLSHLKELNWCIVEQEHFVRCGQEEFEDGVCKFHFKIEDCFNGSGTPNSILLSGVLQYLEEPYALLKKIFEFGIEYLIIDRTPFLDAGPDRLTIQKVPAHIYTGSYPHWFFNLEKFRAFLGAEYEILEEFDSPVDSTDYPARYKGMILKRLGQSMVTRRTD